MLLYGLYAGLGLMGLVVFRLAAALAVTAALHRLVRRRESHFLSELALTAAGTLTCAVLFKERPWLFTVLFTTLTLDVLLDLRAGRPTRLAWGLPLVYVLWANVHVQFIYGLILLGLGCVAPPIDRFLKINRPETAADAAFSAGWWRLVGLALVCALATLVNPYHYHLYEVVLEYATQPGPFRFIRELMALEFRELPDWIMLALFGAAAFALGRRSSLGSFEVLLLAGTAILSFRARRDLWFVTLAALAILATTRRSLVPVTDRFFPSFRHQAGITAALAGLIGLTIAVRGLSPEAMRQEVEQVFPVRAAAWVAEHDPAGPLYNDFNWGGYLIWALPGKPVALDGRTNLHGDERMLRFGNTWAGVPGWRDDPDLSAAGVVLAPTDSALAELLLYDRQFFLTYEDSVARVFVRKSD